MFDILIRGGTLIDGTGAAGRTGDLAIRDGIIVDLGDAVSGTAKRTIEADGALVTPGFIDVHSHYDGQVTWDDKIDPSFSNGITTTIAGNCGVGFAPARPVDHDRLIAVMEGVEAIPGIVLKEGVPWTWESFPEYLDVLAARRFGVDVGVLLPHAPVRVYAMGDRAVAHEQANADDLATMTGCVREAMAAGAFGLSAGRITEHRYGADNANVPGTFAEHEELIALARAVGESGHGNIQLVLRGTVGSFANASGLSPEDRVAEHRLLEELARVSGRPVHYLLQQFDSDPDDWRMMLGETAKARSSGLAIYAHVAARGFGMLSTLDGYHNFMARPSYIALRDLSRDDRLAALRDDAVRARILAEQDVAPQAMPDPQDFGLTRLLQARAPIGYLLDERVDYEPSDDLMVGAVAAATGRTAEAVIYDHMVGLGGRGIVAQMFFNYANRNLDHTFEMLQDGGTLSSLGDGGAHMRLISDVSMLPFHLSYWSRDRRRGPTLPIEQMVAKITRTNARAVGLHDRGELAIGRRADVNVIDFDALKVGLPMMVHDMPAGGARLDQQSTGFVATLLNGVVTRERDTDTGARPGRLVRSGRITD